MVASWRPNGPRNASFYRGGVPGLVGGGTGSLAWGRRRAVSSLVFLPPCLCVRDSPVLSLPPQGVILGGVPPRSLSRSFWYMAGIPVTKCSPSPRRPPCAGLRRGRVGKRLGAGVQPRGSRGEASTGRREQEGAREGGVKGRGIPGSLCPPQKGSRIPGISSNVFFFS